MLITPLRIVVRLSVHLLDIEDFFPSCTANKVIWFLPQAEGVLARRGGDHQGELSRGRLTAAGQAMQPNPRVSLLRLQWEENLTHSRVRRLAPSASMPMT